MVRSRTTLSSAVIAAATAAVAFAALWAAGPRPPAKGSVPSPATTEPVDHRMDTPMAFVDLNRTPLADAIAAWTQRAGVTVRVDWARLDADDLDERTPVTLHLGRPLPAGRVLDAILNAADRPIPDEQGPPTWADVVGQPGVVLVDLRGTLDAAGTVTRVYDVRAIVAAARSGHRPAATTRPDDPSGPAPAAEEHDPAVAWLGELVRRVDANSWTENGGDVASCRYHNGSLIVRCGPRTQADVAHLLAVLAVVQREQTQ